MLSAKVPLPVNRLCRVRQWLSQKVAALDSEQAALEGKQMVSSTCSAASICICICLSASFLILLFCCATMCYHVSCSSYTADAGIAASRVEAEGAGDGGQPTGRGSKHPQHCCSRSRSRCSTHSCCKA